MRIKFCNDTITMKTKSFKIVVASPKRRGFLAPAPRAHSPKKDAYKRAAFKREGYEL